MSAVLPGVPAEFVLPDYAGPNLADVLPAVAASLGASLGAALGPAPSPATAPEDDCRRDGAASHPGIELAPADKVCVVLVDGLGLHALLERGGHAPFLRSNLPHARTLSAGFPSTTATSLTMVGTGCLPGATGMLGYSLRDPASGELTNMLSWGGSARPETWQTCPTVFERLVAQGVGVVSVGKERFRGSGLTQAALRGGAFVGAESLADRVDVAARTLRERGTRLTYLYWGDVDAIGHQKGWGSWEWGDEVAAVDAELARLSRSIPRGTALVITSDHGMVDVAPGDKIDVASTPALREGVDLVAGEPRASHVYCRPGQADAVAERWRSVLAETAWVLLREEAEALGLFGPVAERHAGVIGDVVVAARGRRAVVDSRTSSAASIALVGMHGSLTPAEMLVPLIVAQA